MTEESNTQSEHTANVEHPHEQPGGMTKAEVSRRWLLMKLGMGFNAVVGLALAVPVVGFILSPVKKDKAYKSWVSLGKLGQYPVGTTRLATYVNPWRGPTDGQTDQTACWVHRSNQQEFTVFAINCAHLGCPVRWFPQSKLFMCPCHGGVYYSDGSVAAGPPPRGLFKYKHKIVNGELHIFAGQIPTLSNSAKLVKTIGPCKGDSPCAG